MLLLIRILSIATFIFLLVSKEYATLVQGGLIGLVVFWVLGSIVTHKCFTHGVFEMKQWLKPIMFYLPNLLLFGSVLSWSSVHIAHHKFPDTDKDPHSPDKYSTLKSFFVLFDEPKNMLGKRSLLKDKWCIFFHKNYNASVLFFIGLLALCGITALEYYALIVLYSQIAMFFSSYVYHKKIPYLSYQNYDTKDTSYNNWLAAIFFPGEAYHNNHHKFPNTKSNANKWFEFDLSPYIIKLLEK